MTSESSEENWIACNFSFQCPQRWDRLAATADTHVRHCSECSRDMHLVSTEEQFKSHAAEGHCVAVQRPKSQKLAVGESGTVVGQPRIPFGTKP